MKTDAESPKSSVTTRFAMLTLAALTACGGGGGGGGGGTGPGFASPSAQALCMDGVWSLTVEHVGGDVPCAGLGLTGTQLELTAVGDYNPAPSASLIDGWAYFVDSMLLDLQIPNSPASLVIASWGVVDGSQYGQSGTLEWLLLDGVYYLPGSDLTIEVEPPGEISALFDSVAGCGSFGTVHDYAIYLGDAVLVETDSDGAVEVRVQDGVAPICDGQVRIRGVRTAGLAQAGSPSGSEDEGQSTRRDGEATWGSGIPGPFGAVREPSMVVAGSSQQSEALGSSRGAGRADSRVVGRGDRGSSVVGVLLDARPGEEPVEECRDTTTLAVMWPKGGEPQSSRGQDRRPPSAKWELCEVPAAGTSRLVIEAGSRGIYVAPVRVDAWGTASWPLPRLLVHYEAGRRQEVEALVTQLVPVVRLESGACRQGLEVLLLELDCASGFDVLRLARVCSTLEGIESCEPELMVGASSTRVQTLGGDDWLTLESN